MSQEYDKVPFTLCIIIENISSNVNNYIYISRKRFNNNNQGIFY